MVKQKSKVRGIPLLELNSDHIGDLSGDEISERIDMVDVGLLKALVLWARRFYLLPGCIVDIVRNRETDRGGAIWRQCAGSMISLQYAIRGKTLGFRLDKEGDDE